jgi:ComF family protein
MSSLILDLFASLYAPDDQFCHCCGGVTDSSLHVCNACLQDFQLLENGVCTVCGVPVNKGVLCPSCAAPGLDGGASAFLYGGNGARLIRNYKYDNKRYAKKALGELMAPMLQALLPTDMLIPVPLHRNRLKRRGYNQAHLLCRYWASRGLDTPVADCLERVVETQNQARLTRELRIRNVKNAFRLKSGFSVENKRVLLVDDVYTTGATMSACAAALKEHGAAEVWFLTAAMALHGDTP